MAPNKSMTVPRQFSEKQKDFLLKVALKRGTPAVMKDATELLLVRRASQPGRKAGAVGGLNPFGGVSQVSAAPVSLGNTVRSVKQQVVPSRNGVRVIGRDFVMSIGGTSTAFNGWTFQAGMALSPIALNASGLRGYFQTYEKYVWHRAVAHYITSSPTSIAGDILMVYHTNHGGPKVNHTSSNFLSYALSTDAALIGPQWTNHSVDLLSAKSEELDTDVLNAEDVQHQAAGELLVYTKNTTNGSQPDSPGYLLIDYDVEFTVRMLNPRVLTLPSGVFKWFPTSFQFSNTITQWDKVSGSVTGGGTYSGVTGTFPQGNIPGMIYQVVLDLQNAVFGGTFAPGSQATFMSIVSGYSGIGATSTFQPLVFPVDTGTTVYGVSTTTTGNTVIDLYPSYDAVFAGNTLRWNAASVGAAFTCAMTIACVGSIGSSFIQANIG